MICNNCGNQIEPGASFCKNCGNKIIVSKEEKNKDSKKIIISIIVLILVFAIGIFFGYLIGNQPKVNEKSTSKKLENITSTSEYIKDKIDVSKLKVKTSDDLSSNIKVIKMVYNDENYNNDLFVLLKNENSEPVDVSCYLNYLDKNNKRIDRTINNGYINPGKYYVAILSNMTKEKYNSTNLEIEAKKVKSYMHVLNIDDSNVQLLKEDDKLNISYVNTLDNNINVYYGIIYYKNNEIVFFDSAVAVEIKKGNSATGQFSVYKIPGYKYDKDLSDYYDRYEFFVSAATYKDSTY